MSLPPDDPSSADPTNGPVCPLCSKPIGSKAVTVVEEGELFHILCRTRLTRLLSLEVRDQSRRIMAATDDLVSRSAVLPRRRRLIIVAWSHRRLLPYLTDRFEGRAEVLLDRRDPPDTGSPPSWSGPERRRPLTPPEAAMWRDFGFRMVYPEGQGLNRDR